MKIPKELYWISAIIFKVDKFWCLIIVFWITVMNHSASSDRRVPGTQEKITGVKMHPQLLHLKGWGLRRKVCFLTFKCLVVCVHACTCM